MMDTMDLESTRTKPKLEEPEDSELPFDFKRAQLDIAAYISALSPDDPEFVDFKLEEKRIQAEQRYHS